jgi:hypothetical protein
MNTFLPELRNLVELYRRLANELSEFASVDQNKSESALADSLLNTRASLAEIVQINDRVSRLSSYWKDIRSRMDANRRREAESLLAAAKLEAARLKELCGSHAQRIEKVREKLRKELDQVSRGNQFLSNVKPIKYNYPKFIDSLY